MATTLFRSILYRFRFLIGFSAVTVLLVFVAALMAYKITFTTEDMKTTATSAFAHVAMPDLPPGFQFEDDPSLRVELGDGLIYLYAAYSGSFLGSHETNIEFVTTGYPVYAGNGRTAVGRTIVTLFELLSGKRTDKRIVLVFNKFDIVDETFTIDDKPAIEFVVPTGQDLVGAAAETRLGQAVTGLLERAGKDVSEEARDNWTANTMRKHQSLLLAWFEGIVKNQINGHTIYKAGDSPTEQLVAASFGGFDIEPNQVTLRFYVTAILAAVIAFLFGCFFSFGYFAKQIGFVGKDQKVINLDDETIEKIGNVTDVINDVVKK